MLQKADTQSSDPRVHYPEECSRAKGGGKLSIHFCADGETVETVFRTFISIIQLSICGAVSDLCEECKTSMSEQGDLLWQDNLIHCLCQV